MEGLHREQEKPKFEVLKTIGGSDANKLVNGTFNSWSSIVVSKREGKSKDLSDVLAVQMGLTTEDLNRRWFEKTTELKVSVVEDPLTNAKYDFAHARLDGIIYDENLAVFEAKHTNPFKPPEEQIAKYYGQLQHYMMVIESETSYLSILSGNMAHHIFKVDRDNKYISKLEYIEKYLYQCIIGKEKLDDEFYHDYKEEYK